MSRNDFDALVAPHRAELHAYCYRMLGSLHDAEDALQDALLGAFRGLDGFEGRSSVRAWLYRIATHACLRVIEARPRRIAPAEHGPSTTGIELDPMVEEPIWLEPYPEPADASYELLESVELAFVAALQYLPASQRAALILHDVLGFRALEIAELIDSSAAAVNSALQRARESVSRRVPPKSQQATLRALGEEGQRSLVAAYVRAWNQGDAAAIVSLLAEDARFSMPPLPNWFRGHDAIGRFLAERVFATSWRFERLRASGQLAFAGFQGPEFHVGALNVVTLQGRLIQEMTGFLDPAVHVRFGLPGR